MSDLWLFRLSGAAAVLAGVLRIGTSFLAWDSSLLWLELLATGIDILLLFGLMGFYLQHRGSIGLLGFVGFIIAATGVASIIGPDTVAFGTDTYRIGVTAISIGLVIVSVAMLWSRSGSMIAGALWIAAFVSGLGGGALGLADQGFVVGGILFGLGFVAAGFSLLFPAAKSA